MCKSISMLADVSQVTEQFKIDNVLSYLSNRYEISPTQSVSAIVVRDNSRQLDEFRWGLMPFWGKNSVCMDSRSITDKKVYKLILKKQRCVIPCSGFYVTKTEKKNTQWIKFTMNTGTFGIAGLYDVWRSSFDGEELRTCTMLMTEANSLIAPYQEQMPSILEPDDVEQWLQPDSKNPFTLIRLLRPMDSLRMRSYTLASAEDKFEAPTDFDYPHPELV
ncbi:MULTISPECIES: SOS response-associated peptidase [unclassified Paenibacillus]|uniref:SOS response-associated peptidase n=1 Tax=unclassified Paenibacillus TaxID=185978 RepID=UPI003632D587